MGLREHLESELLDAFILVAEIGIDISGQEQ